VSGPNFKPDWRRRLRYAVDHSGMFHRGIAAEAGITPTTLSRILNAPSTKADFDVVVRLAEVLKVRVGWLVGEPCGLELSEADEKMFQTVAAILGKITDAVDAGRSIAIHPPRQFK
jgi:transcriptional regulator with XRE-family HTH domain